MVSVLLALPVFLLSVASLLPISHGISRSFDFPRTQLAIVAFLILLLAIPIGGMAFPNVIASVLSLATLALHLPWILPYTPLWPVQSYRPEKKQVGHEARVKFMISNVLQDNREYHRVIDLIEHEEPEIVILMEVDEGWQRALEAISKNYPHRLDAYQDNLYGMTLWSKLPCRDAEVRTVVKEGIPSIAARMLLPTGSEFMLYAVHPEPPDPVSSTTERDAEIVLIGLEAKKNALPAIVTGDLNDVAWSRTTQRFLRLSGLVDPRIGRGMYSTFHARYPFLRWPLDQLFHDPRFRLIDIRRLQDVGSDHFPVAFELGFVDDSNMDRNPNGRADQVDKSEAQDLIDAVESGEDSAGGGAAWSAWALRICA